MRAIWTGSLGFGLVNIPIKMFSAVQDSTLDLDMLDRKDHSNIRFKRVNEKTGKEVAWENIVRGYYLNDRYVVLDKSDFEKVIPEKTKHIDFLFLAHPGSITLYEKEFMHYKYCLRYSIQGQWRADRLCFYEGSNRFIYKKSFFQSCEKGDKSKWGGPRSDMDTVNSFEFFRKKSCRIWQ